MKKIIIILLIALTACKSTKDETPPASFNASSPTGLIIGTITFEGADRPLNDIYRFFYEPVTTDKKLRKKNSGRVIIKARDKNVRNYTGDFNNKKSYLFIIEREPGSYAFTQYNYLDHIGYSGMVTSSAKFSIPFAVSAGSISYVGELSYNDLAMQGEPRIVVRSNFSRDVPEFGKKFVGIDWSKAADNTAKSGDTGNGVVKFQ